MHTGIPVGLPDKKFRGLAATSPDFRRNFLTAAWQHISSGPHLYQGTGRTRGVHRDFKIKKTQKYS
jgi:hypothetical protein